jgi:hypothetical protein
VAKGYKRAPTEATENEGPDGRTEDPLGDFAEDLGKFLGGVQSKATSWLEQRKSIAEQLTKIRDTANHYLQQIGAEGAHLAQRFESARRGRPPGNKARKSSAGSPAPSQAVKAGPKKRTMSAEARERIAAAQRARWAKHRKASRAANR